MSSREAILAAVRRAQPAAVPLPAVPLFDAGAADLADLFAQSLARMGGRLVAAEPGQDLTALVSASATSNSFPTSRTTGPAIRCA